MPTKRARLQGGSAAPGLAYKPTLYANPHPEKIPPREFCTQHGLHTHLITGLNTASGYGAEIFTATLAFNEAVVVDSHAVRTVRTCHSKKSWNTHAQAFSLCQHLASLCMHTSGSAHRACPSSATKGQMSNSLRRASDTLMLLATQPRSDTNFRATNVRMHRTRPGADADTAPDAEPAGCSSKLSGYSRD